MKPTTRQVRLTEKQAKEIKAISAAAKKSNNLTVSANSVAQMAVGIGLPETRRKLTAKG